MCDTIHIHEASNPALARLAAGIDAATDDSGMGHQGTPIRPAMGARGGHCLDPEMVAHATCLEARTSEGAVSGDTTARFLTLLTTVPMPTHPALP